MIQNLKASAALSALSLALVSLVSHTSLAEDQLTKKDVFVAGSGGYHSYRIPAVILTPKGTLLAFCEGRKSSRSDHGDLDLVLRRSTDNGKTWTPTQVVHEEGGDASRSATTMERPGSSAGPSISTRTSAKSCQYANYP